MIQLSAQLAATMCLALLGFMFAFGKILMSQFEARMSERFAAQDLVRQTQMEALKEQLVRDGEGTAALKEQVHLLGRTLPLEYVRREDWIRFSASIDHKLDRLAELVIESKLGVARARD